MSQDGSLQPEAQEQLLQQISAAMSTMAAGAEAETARIKATTIQHPLQQPPSQAAPAAPEMQVGDVECDARLRNLLGDQAFDALQPDDLQAKRATARAQRAEDRARQVTRPPNGEPDDKQDNKKAKKTGEEGSAAEILKD